MKTTIRGVDGDEVVYPDAAPSIDPESGTMFLLDRENGVLTEDIPLSGIKYITFEPEEG